MRTAAPVTSTPPAPAPPTDTGSETTPDPVWDPVDHTVADVLAYADSHPGQVQDLYDAEARGKARSTLLDGLAVRGAQP